MAVVLLDVQRMHGINARWGSDTGDQVLHTMGRRLQLGAPVDAVTGHLGGDDFALILPDLDAVAARAATERLLVALRRPIVVNGVAIRPDVTCGIAVGHLSSPELLEDAFLACRRAKRGRQELALTEGGEVRRLAAGASVLADDIRAGMLRDEFTLHYQPTVSLADGSVLGLEALVRWAHPLRGLLLPDEFLPVAEWSGALVRLGLHLLDTAVTQLATWHHAGQDRGRLWINLSAAQLQAGDQLVDALGRHLSAGLDPRDMGFEVTESGLMRDLDHAVGVLEELRSLGFELALDDFGTGYSSLAYLRRLPVTTVKIDRTFVAGPAGVAADLAIIESVVDLAHALELEVLAEGVEDRGHADLLQDLGVDAAQGYWFGRPMPADALPSAFEPWCGRPMVGTTAVRRSVARAAMLFGALDALPVAALVSDAPSSGGTDLPVVASANPALAAALSREVHEVVGRPLNALVATDMHPGAVAEWRAALDSGVPGSVRVPLRSGADDSVQYWDVDIRPFADHRGVNRHRLQLFAPAFGPAVLGGDRVLSLLDVATDGILLIDGSWRVTWINRVMTEMSGHSAHDVVGHPVTDFVHPDDLDRAITRLSDALNLGVVGRSRYMVKMSDQTYRWFEISSRAEPSIGLVINCHDVHDQVLADALADRRNQLDQIVAEVSRWALELGPGSFVTELPRVLSVLGGVLDAHLAEVNALDGDKLEVEATWVRLDHPPEIAADSPEWRAAVVSLLREHRGPVVVSDLDSETEGWATGLRSVPYPDRAVVIVPLVSQATLVGSLHVGLVDQARAWQEHEVALLSRVAETIAHVLVRDRLDAALAASATEIQRLAHHDPLTGLANRAKLGLEMEASLAQRHANGDALLLIDLDGFKSVNDTAGHAAGDELLCDIAHRLVELAGPVRLVSRLGGDEFVIWCPGSTLAAAEELGAQVVAMASRTMVVAGTRLPVGASVGVAHALGADPGALLREADRAMYDAKRAGRGCVRATRFSLERGRGRS